MQINFISEKKKQSTSLYFWEISVLCELVKVSDFINTRCVLDNEMFSMR